MFIDDNRIINYMDTFIDWNKLKLCTYKEKFECIETLKYMIKIGEETRSYGIDSLIQELEKTEDIFLKIGFNIIISGHSISSILKILSNLVMSTELNNKDYLKRVIQFQSIVLYRYSSEVSINDMYKILFSYFGIDFIKQLPKSNEYMMLWE